MLVEHKTQPQGAKENPIKRKVEEMDVDIATISDTNRVNITRPNIPIANDEVLLSTPNPLDGDKPEKLDPSLFDEKDLGELTDIIYLQQLRIFGTFSSWCTSTSSQL